MPTQLLLGRSDLFSVHLLAKFLYMFIVDVVFVARQLIDSAVRGQFYDAIGYGFDKLVVVA